MVLNSILTELEKGPCRATDLAKILVNDENITPENARQRVLTPTLNETIFSNYFDTFF